MSHSQSSSKRIAKNTLYLYIRMVFLMFISFFTSRILLRELGIEDYGIYNVVGSVVSVFYAIQSLLAAATQRFLNIEHGRGNRSKLNKVFSMSIWIHIGLSLVFLFLVLPIGLYIINHYLTIPDNRLYAAEWVFVFSVLSAIVTIMTVPYNAVIMANERMGAFAYIAILEGVLKLCTIILLTYSVFDQLITYAVLIFIVGLIVRGINMVYCHRQFEESRKIKFFWDKQLFLEMSSFAGWQFLGNSGWALQEQGLNMILNIFFGPILNAARGIANQINSALNLFVNNMMTAINPQITKLYAKGEREQMFDLFFRSSKYSFMLFSLLAFPVFLATEHLLQIWLSIVPDYSILFVRLLLIYSFFRVFHIPIDSVMKSSGQIKLYQISDFLCLLVSLPFVYALFSRYKRPELMYGVMIGVQFMATCIALYLCRLIVGLSIRTYFKRVLIVCAGLCLGLGILLYIGYHISLNIWVKTAIFSLIYLVFMLYVGLTKSERASIYLFLKQKIK